MTCANCTATTNGTTLCARCLHTLRVALTNTAAYYADVERIRPGERVKVRSAYQSTPPPETGPRRDPIADQLDAVHNAATTWARVLLDDRPTIGTPPQATTALLGWLESNAATIAVLDWAAELLGDMRSHERDLRRTLDQADTGWYAGVCGNQIGTEQGRDEPVLCKRGLYGSQSSPWVTCPECGRTWDASERRTAMMREARDRLVTVTVAARAVVGLLDGEVSVERLTTRIDQWVSRGRLRSLGVRVLADKRPHRVYRLGDIFDLLDVQLEDPTPPTHATPATADAPQPAEQAC